MDDYVPKPLDQISLEAALARRLPTFDEPPTANGDGGQDGVAGAALRENSLLTDVFRHNSESRGYLRRLEEICGAVQELATEGRLADANGLHGTLERCFELAAELLQRGCPQAQNGGAPAN
jgi:hypothetical protein